MMHPFLASIDPFSTSAVKLAPTVEPAATEPLEPPSMAQVAAEQIPDDDRFVLDAAAFMAAIELPPAFLSAPSPDYLDVIERGFA